MISCIHCKKAVLEEDGLFMNKGFVCTICLYETSEEVPKPHPTTPSTPKIISYEDITCLPAVIPIVIGIIFISVLLYSLYTILN